MTINNDGIFDKYGLIQSIIDDLNRVQVSGYQNMGILLNAAQKLQALKEGLKKEDPQEMGETECEQ